MKFLETLNDYKSRGLVFNQVHPIMPLTIWNYTPETQYGGHWDEVTLSCRGLVTDDKGNIVAKGFSKFFNMEEEKHEATDSFEVFEKLDGSLILVFWYEGQMIVASRGSFTSPYALEAKRLLDEKYPKFERYLRLLDFKKSTTFCFELIGFEQIVVSYPACDLVATGCFQDGNECSLNYANNGLLLDSVPIVKKFDGLDWKNVKGLNWKNSEGFVVKFSNGQRCKIKFEDYIKLHRHMTNLSTTKIWEALAAGEPVSSILNDVPDEFYDKVHDYEKLLKNNYADLEWDIKSRFAIELKAKRNLEDLHGFTELESRKMFAENVAKYPHKSVLFAMLDGKDYSGHIWKMVEPKFEKL